MGATDQLGALAPRRSASATAWACRVALVVGALVVSLLPATARADDKAPAYRVDDPSLVYVGNPRLFKKPCLVSADRVYKSIPEYVEILDKNLTDKDVRYHFLMKKASDKFLHAIREAGKEGGYDLVAGTGAVSGTPTPPDITDAAIGKIPA